MINWGRERMATGDLNDRTYRAYVIDNADPEVLHRVKVRILDIHRGVPDEDLPWASPDSTASQGNSSVTGHIHIPAIGTQVQVQFNSDDPYHITYGGGVFSGDTQNEELVGTKENPANDYPNSRGWVDEAGNKFLINTKQNTVAFTHVSGTTINIAANGSVTVQSANDYTMELQGNGTIKSKQSLTFEAQQDITFNAKGKLNLFSTDVMTLLAAAQLLIKSATSIGYQAPSVNVQTGSAPSPPTQPTAPTAPASRQRPVITLPSFLEDEKTDGGPVGVVDIIGEPVDNT